jgi:hypothetical protein
VIPHAYAKEILDCIARWEKDELARGYDRDTARALVLSQLEGWLGAVKAPTVQLKDETQQRIARGIAALFGGQVAESPRGLPLIKVHGEEYEVVSMDVAPPHGHWRHVHHSISSVTTAGPDGSTILQEQCSCGAECETVTNADGFGKSSGWRFS